jgi:hypothetical protein
MKKSEENVLGGLRRCLIRRKLSKFMITKMKMEA